MLLSVCLIAKDEERFLAGCLEAVREVADEIVLVDTGSTDRTLEIARSHGCRVISRPWDDDFSAARTAGIEVAGGDWILCLDADERLVGAAALRPAILAAPAAVGGFLLERHDLVTHPETGQSDVYPIPMLRLFRRHPGIRYEGIVHEWPNEAVARAGFAIASLSTLKLVHLVNHLPEERLRAKQEKYLRLLEREIERDGGNFRAHYYRAKTLWYLGRKEEAQALFERLAQRESCPLPLRASAWAMRATLLSETGLRGAAVESVGESLALLPEQSLAFFVLAEILYADGRFAEAITAYRRVRGSLDPERGPAAVLGDLAITGDQRAYKLGCCHLALGRLAEAEGHFRAGLSENPDHGGCHYGLARAALLQENRDEALARATAAVRCEPAWNAPRELLAELTAGLG